MVTLPLIPLLPFVGFLVNATLGRRLPKSVSGGLASLAMLASFAVSATIVWQLAGMDPGSRAVEQTLYTWIASGDVNIEVTFRVDPLSAVMILVITGIGSLIHIYSTAYMHDEVDSEFARYFSYLNLFAAFMLVLVLGANFPMMFVGWEGVGLCSYLLIGFWFKKKSASDAGKKAFIVNRIGDYAFLLGMFALFSGVRHARLPAPGRTGRGAAARDGVRRDFHRHAAAVRRRHRQVGSDSALHVAAGRDGRPDAGVGPHPRRDDGDGGRVHDRTQRRALQPRARHADDRGGDRRGHRAHGWHHRARAERHQARAGVLDRLAARADVPGDGGRRVRRRHLPSLYARVLQGVALPRIRRGHPRAAWRAGHPEHGRTEEVPAHYATGRS